MARLTSARNTSIERQSTRAGRSLPARLLTAGLATALLIGLFFSPTFAQDTPVAGGVLRVAITGDPPTLDPHTSTAVIVLEITSHIAEYLYARDAAGQVQPMLAAELPTISADGLTYTIPLRQG